MLAFCTEGPIHDYKRYLNQNNYFEKKIPDMSSITNKTGLCKAAYPMRFTMLG